MTWVRVVHDFDSFRSLTGRPGGLFTWRYVFTLPDYLAAWRDSFHAKGELYLGVVQEGRQIIGAAPLLIEGKIASFMGHSSVCDYMDFSIVPGKEELFYDALLKDLKKRGVSHLDLRCLRPESTVFSACKRIVENKGGVFHRKPKGVSMEMDLPENWAGYLKRLSGKQRHEIRRKMRQFEQSFPLNIRILEKTTGAQSEINQFFRVFRESRADKHAFMDTRMESYFRRLMDNLGCAGVLKLYLLEIKHNVAAASLCFDYQGTVFLYNSCYDSAYRHLSVGLLCNMMSIRHSIETGHKKYDFLKGAEKYKRHLGGREIYLSNALISMA